MLDVTHSSDCKALEYNSSSDHKYIVFTFVGKFGNPSIPPESRKVNWYQYVKTFNRLIPRMSEINVDAIADIEDTVELSMNRCNHFIQKIIPEAINGHSGSFQK